MTLLSAFELGDTFIVHTSNSNAFAHSPFAQQQSSGVRAMEIVGEMGSGREMEGSRLSTIDLIISLTNSLTIVPVFRSHWIGYLDFILN